jgi:hypothetical protein
MSLLLVSLSTLFCLAINDYQHGTNTAPTDTATPTPTATTLPTGIGDGVEPAIFRAWLPLAAN